jgi:flagellar hook-associated protein 3 FlgL
MRVTQTSLSDRALAAIQQGLARIAKSQSQLASGRRIEVPSDDPAGHAAATRLGARVAGIEQFKRQADAARSSMEGASGLLDGLDAIMGRAHELAVQGANGGLTAADRAAMATEVNQLLEEAVATGNSSGADGRYLLGGRQTLTAPLTVTRNGAGDITAATWNPRGVDGAIDVAVAEGVTVQTNLGGTSVLGADADPTFLPTVLIQLRDALNTNNQAAVNGTLSSLDTTQSRLSTARAALGSQLTALDRAAADNDATEVATKAALSAVLDADTASLAVQLSQQQAVYQAALHAAATAIQPSLLEFLQ